MRAIPLVALFLFALGAASAQKDTSGLTLDMIGHAHIDLSYRWRWNEVVEGVAPDTFRGVLDMMDREPGLTFAQSQMSLYEVIEKEDAEMFARVRERIREGRWVVVGGMWSEADMISPSGESLVRQFLIGKKYARQHLGVDVKTGWLPDAFSGIAGTLPQIFEGCGIPYCIVDGRHPPYKIFRWDGPSGSSVIAYPVFLAYNLPPLTPAILPEVGRWSRETGLASVLVLYGRGDHGGGPRTDDLTAMAGLRRIAGAPKIEYQTPQRYFETVVEPRKQSLPVYTGTLPGMTRLSFSSQARIRRVNRAAENLLATAEMFSTLGTLCQTKPSYPRVDFARAWKLVLRNQAHDVLRGTANGRATDDAVREDQAAIEEARLLLRQGLEHIGARIDTSGKGIPLVVYNPASWKRSDVVEAEVRFPVPTAAFVVRDSTGAEAPYQKLPGGQSPGRQRILLSAGNVLPVGFRTYWVHANQRPSARSELRASVSTLENHFLRVRFDAVGTIISLIDKSSGREVLGGRGIQPELLCERPNESSAWNLGLSGERALLERTSPPELVESGPVRAVVRSRFGSEDSAMTLDTILYEGVPRLEFQLEATWYDKDKFLVMNFPTSVREGTFTVEKPYGFEEGKTNGQRQCASRWVDLSSKDFGVSLLNDGADEFWVKNGVLHMGVLRGARDMDPRMDEGTHRFGFALYPHRGDWRGSLTVRQAQELNQPLIGIQEPRHSGTMVPGLNPRGDVVLPPDHSFLSVTPASVVVCALKMQEGSWQPDSLIVRLQETEGRTVKAEISVPFWFLSVEETNLLEETQRVLPARTGAAVPLEFGPGEIKTLRFTFIPPHVE